MITIKISSPKNLTEPVRKVFEDQLNKQIRNGGYSGVSVKIDSHGNMTFSGPEEEVQRYCNRQNGTSYEPSPERIDTKAGKIDTRSAGIKIPKTSTRSPRKKK
jgi:hypothetical protein